MNSNYKEASRSIIKANKRVASSLTESGERHPRRPLLESRSTLRLGKTECLGCAHSEHFEQDMG